jgi:hypothetical protein
MKSAVLEPTYAFQFCSRLGDELLDSIDIDGEVGLLTVVEKVEENGSRGYQPMDFIGR